MSPIHRFLADLGASGGLLLGAPLVLIGLAMRGLARRQLARFSLAARSRRRVVDVTAPGPVAVVGIARTCGDRVYVEEAGTQIAVELDAPATDGAVLLVCGEARPAAHAGSPIGPSAYRSEARAFVVDARGEAHFATPFHREPVAVLPTLRLQAFLGALVFAVGVLLGAASSAVELSLSLQ